MYSIRSSIKKIDPKAFIIIVESNEVVGEHDFKSFCGAGAQVKTTVRKVQEICISREDSLITIKIRGKGFLYNMVRIIAGSLMEIGQGMYPPEHMKEILEAKDRQAAGPTAPARGLTLVGIQYLEEKPIVAEGEKVTWA